MSGLKLTRTSSIFVVEDPGGWLFRIETIYDPDIGWHAESKVQTDGIREERDAIEHLRTPLRRLLARLDEEFGYEDAVHHPGGAP